MNTTDNKANGYAMKTDTASEKGLQLRLDGFTLWVIDEKSEDNYVVVNDEARVFVKLADESDYEEYSSIDAAMSALDEDEGKVVQVVAICDKTTGYADTLIIREVGIDETDEPEVDLTGITVVEEDDRSYTIYSVRKLSAFEISGVIRDYLNDSNIASVSYDASNPAVGHSGVATITSKNGDALKVNVTVKDTGYNEKTVTAIKMVDGAKDYTYSDGFTYAGDFTIDANTITVAPQAGDDDYFTPSIGGADGDDITPATADLARFLGALYRESGAKTIVYKGTTYTWDADLGLKGSNWADSADNTLVDAITTKVATDLGLVGGGGGTTSTINLTVDTCPITITVNKNAAP